MAVEVHGLQAQEGETVFAFPVLRLREGRDRRRARPHPAARDRGGDAQHKAQTDQRRCTTT